MSPIAVSGRASIVNKRWKITAILGGIVLLVSPGGVCRAQVAFQQTNLVSSVSGLAPVTDGNLKNPWGVSFSSSGPFWVSNQVTKIATVYDGAGAPFPVGSPLLVTIPTLGGSPSGPTGLVSNPTSDFQLTPGNPALFLFANLEGTVLGWNPAVNPTTAVISVLSTDGAVYTGLALGNNGSGNFLYAADAANAKIDVYDTNFSMTSVGGSFIDPILPAGFTPYNIQNLGGTLYITYKNDSAGGGIVDAFDLNGSFLRRISANSAGGPLDSPWGLALTPASFGPFGGALLVGNFGDGLINAFDPLIGSFLGQLLDAQGDPIGNAGLRGLSFGNGGNGGDPNTLYFTAGIVNESEGLFGSIGAIAATVTPTQHSTATPTAAPPTDTPTRGPTNTASPVPPSSPTPTPSSNPPPPPTPTPANAPPDCSAARASLSQLWPANHEFVPITISGVTDPDGDHVSVTIAGISQDEPVKDAGTGSGSTCPDGTGIATGTAQVRAERGANPRTLGDGRVYHVGFTADDGRGGTCRGAVTVCVPHDQRPGATCVDGGPVFDSTVCP
jgi:uncharacterized protein (TIGR03118 family)